MSDSEFSAGQGDNRERAVTAAFVSIADGLLAGHDLVDLYAGLTADCARILDVAAAGLMIADAAGTLQVAGASSESARRLELFALQSQEGPCLDCFRTGAPVSVGDLRGPGSPWPRFVPAARAAGIVSVHALPMRLGGQVLGVLGLFGAAPGTLNDDDLRMGAALARVAGVVVGTGRAAADKALLNAQLQTALDSRVVLEQAKGVLAQLGGLDMPQAFSALRRYSRDHSRRLADIAEAVVSRELGARAVLDHGRAKGVLGPVPAQPAPPRKNAATPPACGTAKT